MRHRVRSLAPNYRDPFLDDLHIVLEQMRRESREIPSVTVDAGQALRALICDAYSEPCFRCDRKPDTVEVYFVPESLAKFNQKVIFYSLCADCKMDVMTRATVEERLAYQLSEENAFMGVA